jgi:hypothetical protein
MEIKIKFSGRTIDYEVGGETGSGIDDLIGLIGQKNDRIEKVSLSGSTDSYTLMRQVYLLMNLCRALTGCSVFVAGKKSESGELLPDYESAGYKFSGDGI